MDDLVLSHATERDIDLLVVEELVSSRQFVSLFLEQAEEDIEVINWTVTHSKRRKFNRREIDIEVSINDQSLTLFIENKLDALEQHNQAESYREEVQRLQAEGRNAYSLLMCPLEYGAANTQFANKFDRVVTYEALRSHFDDRLAS